MLKKLIIPLLLSALLTSCGTPGDLPTVSDTTPQTTVEANDTTNVLPSPDTTDVPDSGESLTEAQVFETSPTTQAETTEKDYTFEDMEILMQLKLNRGAATSSVQGMAIYEGKLFQLYNTGYCNVYDLASGSGTPLAGFPLGSAASTNHANSANFGSIHYEQNQIPLLYVVDGNSGNIMKCSVENITQKDGVYSSEKVQEINLDQSGFEAAGYVPYWGWPAWLVGQDSEYLYLHGAKYRTNGSMNAYYDDNRYIITKFRLPSASEKNVLLTADDVLEQFTTEYDVNVTQGGTVWGKYLFYTFGFGKPEYPSALRVWDLEKKELAASVDLSQIAEELEDCCVWGDKLYIVTQKTSLFTLALK